PEKAIAFHSLGTLKFLSLIKHCNAIVGNSSSGILEAPSLFTATINIGNRQKGRVQAKSIVNCNCELKDILKAFNHVNSSEFQKKLKNVDNPYDNGGTANKVFKVLLESKVENSIKSFNDLLWK